MNVKAKQNILNTFKTMALPVLVIALFALITDGRSLSERTLLVTLRQSVIPIVISMAIVGNMTLGIMDFSVGAVVVSSSIIGANLMQMTGTGIPGLVVFCILTGVGLTSLTGFLNNKLRVPTLVLTIGLMICYEALPRIIFPKGAIITGSNTILSTVPWIFMIAVIVFIAYYVLYNFTTYGHNNRALGGNEDIAKSAGLNLPRIKQLGFSISGVFLGVAAVLYMSSNAQLLNVAMFGSMSLLFDAFMGYFLAMFLARYCNIVIGVAVGAFTMATLTNGFVAMGMTATMRDIVTGLFLLVLLCIAANQGRLRNWRGNNERARLANLKYSKTNFPSNAK